MSCVISVIEEANIFGVGEGSINMTYSAPVYFANNVFEFINVNDSLPFPPELSPNLNPDPLPNRTNIVDEGTEAFNAFGTFSTPAGSGILAGESIDADIPALVDLRSFRENGIIRDLILPNMFIHNNTTFTDPIISALGERFITWDVDGNGQYGNPGDVFFSFYTFTTKTEGSRILLNFEGELEFIDPDGSIVDNYKADNPSLKYAFIYTKIPFTLGFLSIQTDGVANLNDLPVFASVEEFNSVDPSDSEDIAIGTMASAITGDINMLPVIPPCFPTMGETASINNVTNNWQTISLNNSYENPVVIAQPLSNNGAEPATVRLRNIDYDSFQIKLQEPSLGVTPGHVQETVHYFVFEEGTWELDNGALLEVGTLNANSLVNADNPKWFSVDLDHNYTSTPTILTQVQTFNGSDYVNTRMRNLSKDGFNVGLEEEEAKYNSGHVTETVGYVALTQGSGQWSGLDYVSGITGNVVNSSWHDLNWGTTFSEEPNFVASLASYNGRDSANLRYQNLTTTDVDIKVAEETSSNIETTHVNEQVAYLAFAGDGDLSAFLF